MKKQENGRSMVEMLGVLSIIGILSIAGVSGYGVAMRRMEANNIMDTALKFSAQGIGKVARPDTGYVLLSSLSAAGMTVSSSVESMKLKTSKLGKTVCIKFSTDGKDRGIPDAFDVTAREYIKTDCKLPDGTPCCDTGEVTFVNETKTKK